MRPFAISSGSSLLGLERARATGRTARGRTSAAASAIPARFREAESAPRGSAVPMQVDEERAVERMARAEDEQLVERRRRRRGDGCVFGSEASRAPQRASGGREPPVKSITEALLLPVVEQWAHAPCSPDHPQAVPVRASRIPSRAASAASGSAASSRPRCGAHRAAACGPRCESSRRPATPSAGTRAAATAAGPCCRAAPAARS